MWIADAALVFGETRKHVPLLCVQYGLDCNLATLLQPYCNLIATLLQPYYCNFIATLLQPYCNLIATFLIGRARIGPDRPG